MPFKQWLNQFRNNHTENQQRVQRKTSNPFSAVINSLIIMMTLIHKIPPNLPLQREEIPLFGKEGLALLNSGHTSRLKEAI
jgi:hypothetical protein